MKKLLSVILAAAMLLGCLSLGVVAASDTCIRLSDTTGSTGYSAGSDAVNEWFVQNGGGTVIFDVKLESVATPGADQTSRLVAFTGDSPYNYAGFDFTNGRVVAGADTSWPTAAHTTYDPYSTRNYIWNVGDWHELAIQFDGVETTVYLDGVPMVAAEVDQSFATKYVILYPQYCTVLIDNMRICGKDYNVTDRYGEIYTATGFDGVTAVGGVSCWYFSEGYSVTAEGRAMPELSEMLPERTVAPTIEGAYLKYSEGTGNGVAASALSFTDYNGFTYVEDVRIERKSALASIGVRFGNYIAGYDFDSGKFLITNKSGYGFNKTSAYVYASTEYALSLKTTYELAVKVNGNVCSVYLNGVLMAQAANDAFDDNFTNVDVAHYRMGASVDNVVVAYPDYNAREATGSAAGRFTFDEDAAYIDGIWDFNLDTGTTGYTVAKDSSAAAVTVDSVEASDGKATVGISLEGCTDFNSFELDIAYPAGFTVVQIATQSILDGVSAVSPTGNNPVTVSYVAPAGESLTDGKIVNVVFNTPEDEGAYTVTAAVTPYKDDIPGAVISSTGTITVPEPGLPVGLPDGLAYDGEYLTWNAPDNALAYEIYMLYEGDDYEMYVDYTEDPQYYFPYADYIPDPGLYTFRVYMYDDTFEMASVSEDFGVIVEEDGNIVTGGLPGYAAVLAERLSASVAGNEYTKANQATVDGYLADAAGDMAYATDLATLLETYEAYAALLAEVPVGGEETYYAGDVDGDGDIDNTDFSTLSRFLKGAGVTVTGGADIDGSGSIDNIDLSKLRTILKSN